MMWSYITPRIWPFSSGARQEDADEVETSVGPHRYTSSPEPSPDRNPLHDLSSPISIRSSIKSTTPYYPHPPPRHPRSRAATITSRLIPFSTSSPLTRQHPLPPQSRIDPSSIQRPPPSGGPLRWDRTSWTAFVYFLTSKGYDIVGSLVSYGIYGPPKPSWGLEMTLIAAFMRNVGQHSALADIGLVRQLISFHHLLPLPPDAIVTPITFRLKKRTEGARLRGFFAEWDERETGEREMSGEWVVGKKVYRRLKREERERKAGVGKAPPEITQNGTSMKESPKRRTRSEKVIYYIHGGAYYVGSVATHRLITIAISKTCNARVFAINYRLAPETRFPEPLLDVVNGYFRLIDDLRIAPENIVVMGDSAGGGMALAMTMYLRDEGYIDRLPRALVLMSPWVDLTMSCGSWDENAKFDVVPIPGKDDHLNPVSCYLGPEGIRKYLTHPYASPLFGDLRGLPPMLIQAGDAEVLRDEITLLAHKAALAGVQVKHELHIDQVHVFQTFPFLESAQMAFQSIGNFVAGIPDSAIRKQDTADLAKQDASKGQLRTGILLPSQTLPGLDTVGSEIAGADTKVVRRDGTEVEAADTSEDDTDFASSASKSRRRTIGDSRTAGRSLPTSPRQTRNRQPLLRRALSGFVIRADMDGTTTDSDMDDSETSLDGPKSTFSFNTAMSGSPKRDHHLPGPEPAPKSPRRRRPTVSTHVATTPLSPTVRARSKSHSSISTLIDSYGIGGPANSTTLYAPSRRGSDDGMDDPDSDGEQGMGLGLSMTTPGPDGVRKA